MQQQRIALYISLSPKYITASDMIHASVQRMSQVHFVSFIHGSKLCQSLLDLQCRITLPCFSNRRRDMTTVHGMYAFDYISYALL